MGRRICAIGAARHAIPHAFCTPNHFLTAGFNLFNAASGGREHQKNSLSYVRQRQSTDCWGGATDGRLGPFAGGGGGLETTDTVVPGECWRNVGDPVDADQPVIGAGLRRQEGYLYCSSGGGAAKTDLGRKRLKAAAVAVGARKSASRRRRTRFMAAGACQERDRHGERGRLQSGRRRCRRVASEGVPTLGTGGCPGHQAWGAGQVDIRLGKLRWVGGAAAIHHAPAGPREGVGGPGSSALHAPFEETRLAGRGCAVSSPF